MIQMLVPHFHLLPTPLSKSLHIENWFLREKPEQAASDVQELVLLTADLNSTFHVVPKSPTKLGCDSLGNHEFSTAYLFIEEM